MRLRQPDMLALLVSRSPLSKLMKVNDLLEMCLVIGIAVGAIIGLCVGFYIASGLCFCYG
jgi:hypothetical protein